MIAATLTVALAFVGHVATCLDIPRLTQRQERPARVNRRLGGLYGPLYALADANARTTRSRPTGGCG
ncbi:hypothetical protein ACIPX0_15370 [Streptomyces sp. NPDC090075]|uniref:hypothetical protein n=1 Tax=Streptomyces sp. NPDC090075 TaxID=3365937 RepID=UPI0037FE3FB5